MRALRAAATSALRVAVLGAGAQAWAPTGVAVRGVATTLAASGGDPAGAATTTARPFRILGLQQVAVGGLDKAKMARLWKGMFGLTQVTTFQSAKENVDEDVLKLGRGEFAVEVDLMQPMDATKSPKVHDPPLNHIGLWVDDLPAAVTWLTAQGVRFAPGGIRRGASGFDITFIHPKGNEASPIGGEGVLIELVQAPPAVIAAFDKLAA